MLYDHRKKREGEKNSKSTFGGIYHSDLIPKSQKEKRQENIVVRPNFNFRSLLTVPQSSPPIQAKSAEIPANESVKEEVTVNEPIIQEKSEDPPNLTGLPDDLKAGVENLSGYSLDDVRVHYNSSKPAQLQALAYTQGTEIHVGPGQEKHLAHEAWHVVQQMQGRVKPTMQMNGVRINDDEGLEREADDMSKKGLQENTTYREGQVQVCAANTVQRVIRIAEKEYEVIDILRIIHPLINIYTWSKEERMELVEALDDFDEEEERFDNFVTLLTEMAARLFPAYKERQPDETDNYEPNLGDFISEKYREDWKKIDKYIQDYRGYPEAGDVPVRRWNNKVLFINGIINCIGVVIELRDATGDIFDKVAGHFVTPNMVGKAGVNETPNMVGKAGVNEMGQEFVEMMNVLADEPKVCRKTLIIITNKRDQNTEVGIAYLTRKIAHDERVDVFNSSDYGKG